jgi:hypothetical protein
VITFILYSNKLNVFVLLHIKEKQNVIEWDYNTLLQLQNSKADFVTEPLDFSDDWIEIGLL